MGKYEEINYKDYSKNLIEEEVLNNVERGTLFKNDSWRTYTLKRYSKTVYEYFEKEETRAVKTKQNGMLYGKLSITQLPKEVRPFLFKDSYHFFHRKKSTFYVLDN